MWEKVWTGLPKTEDRILPSGVSVQPEHTIHANSPETPRKGTISIPATISFCLANSNFAIDHPPRTSRDLRSHERPAPIRSCSGVPQSINLSSFYISLFIRALKLFRMSLSLTAVKRHGPMIFVLRRPVCVVRMQDSWTGLHT